MIPPLLPQETPCIISILRDDEGLIFDLDLFFVQAYNKFGPFGAYFQLSPKSNEATVT